MQTVRAVEAILGIVSEVGSTDLGSAESITGSLTNLIQTTGNLTEALIKASTTTNGTVVTALAEAAPMLLEIADELGISDLLLTEALSSSRTPLTTT